MALIDSDLGDLNANNNTNNEEDAEVEDVDEEDVDEEDVDEAVDANTNDNNSAG